MKFFVILFMLCSCGATKQDNSTAVDGISDDSIKVKLNEKFEIKLDVNFGTGYSWLVADSNFKDYLRLDSSYSISNTDKEGGPALQVFRYLAIAKGRTALKFIYIRPWRKEDKPEKEKSYQIIIE